MATIPTFTSGGVKAASAVSLDANVFGVTPKNHELLHLAYVSYLANGRPNLAVTKTRGLISGGGRKPWKQKGTGRARFGSSRNPIWRGGGIVFGPTGEENYTKQLNVKAKRLAIRQALSLAADAKQVVAIESMDWNGGKAAGVAKLLAKIGATGKVLLVVTDTRGEAEQATRNLQDVHIVSDKYLNTYDILNARVIVFEKAALTTVSEWLGESKKEGKA